MLTLWVGHDIGAVALHQVWQHEEPRLAAAGAADDQHVLVARVLWILRAALHRQKLRRREDHVAAKFGGHVRLDVLMRTPARGAILRVVPVLFGVSALHDNNDPQKRRKQHADEHIAGIQAGQWT